MTRPLPGCTCRFRSRTATCGILIVTASVGNWWDPDIQVGPIMRPNSGRKQSDHCWVKGMGGRTSFTWVGNEVLRFERLRKQLRRGRILAVVGQEDVDQLKSFRVGTG